MVNELQFIEKCLSKLTNIQDTNDDQILFAKLFKRLLKYLKAYMQCEN
jgi:hypothetical protein